jgi:HEPN domain-containing protein
MNKKHSYYDFAENDYKFYENNYQQGNEGNLMASIAQEICEKYLKHIIEDYVECDLNEKSEVLHTHNLRRILNYISEKLEDFECDRNEILKCNGFYFETRYPGEESYFVTREDIDNAHSGVLACKQAVEQYVQTHKIEMKAEQSIDEINSFINRKSRGR